MLKQTTHTLLLIRPLGFRKNEQTELNNYYQQDLPNVNAENIVNSALKEFDALVENIKSKGIEVLVVDSIASDDTPDAVFPNNWVSFHQDGTLGVYPMFAENRRRERREQVIEQVEAQGFVIEDVIDYSSAEEEGYFLEGTGSVVLDRVHKKAYCSISARSDEDLFIEFCEDFEYTPILFTANQTVHGERKAIYHTNVLLSIGEGFAVICLESIEDKKERKQVLQHLKQDGKELIVVTEAQVASFAANILQVTGLDGEKYILMSESARHVYRKDQIEKLEKHGEIISSELKTIETCGGGSVRCMIAEVFLPKRS